MAGSVAGFLETSFVDCFSGGSIMQPETFLLELIKGSATQIVGGVVGLIGFAYHRCRKILGKKKADALLSKIIRGALQINPDVFDLKTNTMKYGKLVGKEDGHFSRVLSLVGKTGVRTTERPRTGRAMRVSRICRLPGRAKVVRVVTPKAAKKRKRTKRAKK